MRRFSKNENTCQDTPSDSDSGSYEINLPYYGGGSVWLVWNDKLLKALNAQSICTIPQRGTFTERLLTCDAKATFKQAALRIKVLLKITKHAFPRIKNIEGQETALLPVDDIKDIIYHSMPSI